MQLDEFVATTLRQIVAGVQSAQATTADSGARINPQVEAPAMRAHGVHQPATLVDWESGTLIQEIAFDVAVTVSESEKSGAGLKIAIPLIGAGLEGGSTRQGSAINRIQFTVPLVLPKHPYPQK